MSKSRGNAHKGGRCARESLWRRRTAGSPSTSPVMSTLHDAFGLKREGPSGVEPGGPFRVLVHLGLPTAGASLTLARAPPQGAGC
jgi:hypothetical protein